MDKRIEENLEIETQSCQTGEGRNERVLDSLLEHVEIAREKLHLIQGQINSQNEIIGQSLLDLGAAFNNFNGIISNHNDANSIIAVIDKLLRGAICYDACALVLFESPNEGSLATIGNMLNDSMVEQIQQHIVDAIESLGGGRPTITSRSITARNLETVPATTELFQSFCNVPINSQGKMWGVLQIASTKTSAFKSNEIKHLHWVAEQISVVEDNIQNVLLSERNKLEAIINNMTDGVVAVGKKGNIELINPVARKLLNVSDSADDFQIRGMIEAIGLKSVFSEKHCKEKSEFVGKASNNRILQFKWASVEQKKKEQFAGKVLIIRDVTSQIELDRAQTEFITAISHELRTPLTTLQNSVSNLLAGVAGSMNAKAQWYLDAMGSDCQRLSHLINDLLDMAKLEAGKMAVNRSTANVMELAAKVASSFHDEASAKNISIECAGDNTIARVYVDEARICQVMSNLLSNAVKYTHPSGVIKVRVFETAEEVVTAIEDSGIGIAPDRIGKVFNKFYQISREAGPGYKGSGLGLALSKEIIAIHGGRMWVESELGQGSTFYFSLPKTRPEIVVRKHIEGLMERSSRKGQKFTVISLKLENEIEGLKNATSQVNAAMQSIMSGAEGLAKMADDLVIRTAEREIIMVLGQSGKRLIQSLKRQLGQIIYDALMKSHCNDGSILPMLGMSLYPNDSSDICELVEKARRELNRI